MSDIYKLVFRGELQDGQHAAVVRRRLGELLALDAARLEQLFCGRPVVVKSQADAANAARFQDVFRKAGARLVVIPLPDAPEVDPGAAAGITDVREVTAVPAAAKAIDGANTPERAAADPMAGASESAFTPELLPVGSDVLREDERAPWEPRDIETGHLALQDPAQVQAVAGPPPPPAPDTSRLSLLEPD